MSPTTEEILKAARKRRVEAARAYVLALQSSIVVGEDCETMAHDHRQFCLRGLDMIKECQSGLAAPQTETDGRWPSACGPECDPLWIGTL